MATLAIDWASTDGIYQPDFAKAKAAGMRTAIPRSIYGRRAKGQVDKLPVYLDPCWKLSKDAIKAAGLKRSNYAFVCVPKKGYQTEDPEIQAQYQIEYGELERPCVGGYCGDYPPVFDVEEQTDAITAEAYYDWICRYAKKLFDHYGVWPIMYTSNRVWQEYLKGHASGALQGCPLWIAKPWPWNIRTPIHLDGAAGFDPTTIPQFGDGTNWLWYQYQGDATQMPGFQGAVDASRPQVVRNGMKGTIVKYVQARVGATVDGNFGPATEAAVKTFQASYHLGADGIVGNDTWAPLTGTPPHV